MVLEEASAPAEPSFTSDSSPTSDQDPYSGDRTPTLLSTRDPTFVPVNSGNDQVYVNLANLPKPFMQSSHPPFMTSAIQDTCKAVSTVLQRPVRQEEADALAYHLCRGLRIGSYGGSIGTLCAIPLFFRGMSKFRFPGWTPGSKFNPDKFIFLQGQRARVMWHMNRAMAYGFVGSTIGHVTMSSYALTVGSAGRMMDPRLKDLSQKLRENARNGQGGLLPGKREVDETAGPRQRDGETFEMARQRQQVQEAWRRHRQQGGGKAGASSGYDDASPTGGAFAGDFVEEGSNSQSDTFVLNDAQAQKQISSQTAPSQDSQQSQRQAQRREEPSDPFGSAPRETESKPAGSAWERLRQQAASGGSQSRSPSTRSPPTSRPSSQDGDSFTFSNADEDKQLARAEAQKQFDARIEREREGKDFEDSRGRRGW